MADDITVMDSFVNWKNAKFTFSRVNLNNWHSINYDNFNWLATYMTDEIPADNTWNTFATKNKKNLEKYYKSLNIPKDGSLHYMCIRPNLLPDLKIILEPYKNLSFNYNFLKLPSGCNLMWHFDTYATFVKFNNVDEDQIQNVCRAAIMLRDWDRGQILQIGNHVLSHWSAGDTYTWKGDTWHGLGNFGPSNIIIAQITYLKK